MEMLSGSRARPWISEGGYQGPALCILPTAANLCCESLIQDLDSCPVPFNELRFSVLKLLSVMDEKNWCPNHGTPTTIMLAICGKYFPDSYGSVQFNFSGRQASFSGSVYFCFTWPYTPNVGLLQLQFSITKNFLVILVGWSHSDLFNNPHVVISVPDPWHFVIDPRISTSLTNGSGSGSALFVSELCQQ